eukprot:gene14522-biopygen6623
MTRLYKRWSHRSLYQSTPLAEADLHANAVVGAGLPARAGNSAFRGARRTSRARILTGSPHVPTRFGTWQLRIALEEANKHIVAGTRCEPRTQGSPHCRQRHVGTANPCPSASISAYRSLEMPRIANPNCLCNFESRIHLFVHREPWMHVEPSSSARKEWPDAMLETARTRLPSFCWATALPNIPGGISLARFARQIDHDSKHDVVSSRGKRGAGYDLGAGEQASE